MFDCVCVGFNGRWERSSIYNDDAHMEQDRTDVVLYILIDV